MQAVRVTAGTVNASGTTHSLGNKKFAAFAGSLAATNAVTTAYADGDVLVQLGSLDTSISGTLPAASFIIIDKVIFNVTTIAGQTLAGTLKLSATNGTATNVACATPTEIVGAGATYTPGDLGTPGTAADVNFNNASTVASIEPNIVVASTLKHLYACTTTAINADITAGRFTVYIEYTVV